MPREPNCKYDNALNENFLRENYINKMRSASSIAREIGCSTYTVKNKLGKFNIRMRDRGYDLIGKLVGKLIVIERVKSREGGKWKLRCECGNTIILHTSQVLRANKYATTCGECLPRYGRKELSTNYTGYKDISGVFWGKIFYCAKKRGIDVDITIQYAWELYSKQDKKCALTGLDLLFADSSRDHVKGLTTASLDRIDSTKGYIEDNVQWIHKDLQKIKGALPEGVFKQWCHRVSDYDYLLNYKGFSNDN